MSRWYVFLPQIPYLTHDGPINKLENVLWIYLYDPPSWL